MNEKIQGKADGIINRFSQGVNGGLNRLEDYIDAELLWPEMRYIKDEIIDCLLINASQAAITLTNHFLEKTLKLGLVYHTSGGKKVHFGDQLQTYEDALLKYDGESLHNNIESCFGLGLIDEQMRDSLHKFRKEIRNAFSHAEAKKTFGNLTAPAIIVPTDNPNHYKMSAHPIANMPFIHGMAQQILAEELAYPYFATVYTTLRMIETNVEQMNRDKEGKN